MHDGSSGGGVGSCGPLPAPALAMSDGDCDLRKVEGSSAEVDMGEEVREVGSEYGLDSDVEDQLLAQTLQEHHRSALSHVRLSLPLGWCDAWWCPHATTRDLYVKVAMFLNWSTQSTTCLFRGRVVPDDTCLLSQVIKPGVNMQVGKAPLPTGFVRKRPPNRCVDFDDVEIISM